METVQYMGSKKNLLSFIDDSIADYCKNDIKIFYDVFAGSGRVSYYFANKYDIISSDKQNFTKIILDAYLNSNESIIEQAKCELEKLNNLPDAYFYKTDAWFTINYSTEYNDGVSIGLDKKPKIWLSKNAKKIDMIRTKIDEIENIQVKNICLLSLVLAVNKISNTLGHQNGYLRKWAKNTLNDLFLVLPKIETKKHNSINLVGDVFDILPQIKADIFYFDPPYGTTNTKMSHSTRYSCFYHIWNTLVKNDRPTLWGKANKPLEVKGETKDIEINKKEVIKPLFEKLFTQSNCKYIALSYSNQGLLTEQEITDIIIKAGYKNVVCYKQKHKINNQSKLAIKDGTFIVGKEKKQELIEYLFLAENNVN